MKYTIVKISEIMKLQVGERANFDGITVSIAVAGALRPLSSYSATASVMKRKKINGLD